MGGVQLRPGANYGDDLWGFKIGERKVMHG